MKKLMMTRSNGDPRLELALLHRTLIGSALFMVVLLVGVQIARAEPAATTVPGTTAYLFSSHPMISGTVVSVNDRQMVVNTDQGEQVALQIDSRTMAPRDLAPGMVMRAEFQALEDCRFYAQRILAIRHGVSTDRLQAYANTRDSEMSVAENNSGLGEPNTATVASATKSESRVTQTQEIGEHSPGRSMTATPASADYLFSTNPMVSGKLVTVNDHRLVMETIQGQKVGMVMDSHTMLAREIAPGDVVRTEFSQMDDGRYYAKRISRIGRDVVAREQAYAHTRDSDFALASNTPDCGFVNAAAPAAFTSAAEPSQPVAEPLVTATPVVAPVEPVAEAPAPELPQTASNQPWLLLFGLLALVGAGFVTIAGNLRRS